jgi:hypothetical protein
MQEQGVASVLHLPVPAKMLTFQPSQEQVAASVFQLSVPPLKMVISQLDQDTPPTM